ncbi:MAG: ATP synthase F1 subunit epsilon [Elusimicrobia bacterium]|nr:ATP synthase F1 subunit epsilon [Elusimicrobiota bacterium]MBU2615451.1 ATP synthase F1 subunit epsilon [Elusimicrobiota bacterium]
MKTIPVEIITPEKLVLKDEMESIVIPSYEGELGILPGHTHLLAQIQPGEISLTKNKETKYFVVSGGFAEVHPDKVEIFAETAELGEELDFERAKQALEKAKFQLKEGKDILPAGLAMRRALARLKVVERVQVQRKKRKI